VPFANRRFGPAGQAKVDAGAIGLRGFWRGYFASRSAALGSASAEFVTALFFGFAPGMVRRALPAASSRLHIPRFQAQSPCLARLES